MNEIFTEPNAWVGGLYELCIELPGRTEFVITQALATIWQVSVLNGCYLTKELEPDAQKRISPWNVPHNRHVYGIAKLPNAKSCACGTYISDFDADGLWVALYLPLGSLARAYHIGGYPFGDWSPAIESSFVAVNTWLKEIAEIVYNNFRFSFGVIGFESGFEELKKEVLAGGIRETRSEGVLIPEKDRLRWYPPTYDRRF